MDKKVFNKRDRNLTHIAGLFDGEGHVSMPISKREGHLPQYWLQIGITNRNKNVLEYVQEMLGVGHINVDERKNNPSKARICYRWISNSKEAKKVLKMILPYLRIKKRQTELGIKFQLALQSPALFGKRAGSGGLALNTVGTTGINTCGVGMLPPTAK